jgi:hypothetical protein
MSSIAKARVPDSIAQALIGKSAVRSIVADDGRVTLKQLRKQLSHARMLNRQFRDGASGIEHIGDAVLAHLRPVVAPIALVSQIQRCGGTLLSQLFDGHPELDAHPHELKIGYPRKDRWPRIDLSDTPTRCFEVLAEDVVVRHFRQGYEKSSKADSTFPFVFIPSLQRRIFIDTLQSRGFYALRYVFNAYMTSYFGAWLNYQNANGNKKYVTAFAAKLGMHEPSMEAFFETYPDGRLISVVRDPKNWFPSARRLADRGEKYRELEPALDRWKDSAAAMLRNRQTYGDKVCILRFEDLIGRTDAVMQHVADFLDIAFDDILLTPTFNGAPIEANTSFQAETSRIMSSTLERHKTLSESELETIESVTQDTYSAVLKECTSF